MQFSNDTTSDQKRLARAEHWRFARSLLRARDRVHHKPWRVMILAGHSPEFEMGCIRELMPKAHITAVDVDQEAVIFARERGADACVCCELNCYEDHQSPNYLPTPCLPEPLYELVRRDGQFDAIHLDFCTGPNEQNRDTVRGVGTALNEGGVMVVSFSYGRDVVEFFDERSRKLSDTGRSHDSQKRHLHWSRLLNTKLRPSMCSRIEYVLGDRFLKYARSVILYQGNRMPMCSVLCSVNKSRYDRREPISVIELNSSDLELMVCVPDAGRLYGLPEERITAIRRSFIAKQAAHTTRVKRKYEHTTREIPVESGASA